MCDDEKGRVAFGNIVNSGDCLLGQSIGTTKQENEDRYLRERVLMAVLNGCAMDTVDVVEKTKEYVKYIIG